MITHTRLFFGLVHDVVHSEKMFLFLCVIYKLLDIMVLKSQKKYGPLFNSCVHLRETMINLSGYINKKSRIVCIAEA